MNLNTYQRTAQSTAMYPGQYGLIYTALGLAGEGGEVANKVKKLIRDANGEISPEAHQALVEELGDVMWYVAMLAYELNVPLETVAQTNIDKLASRHERGRITGEGDNR